MLRAGFARLDITPGTDVDLLGYAFRQESLPAGNDGPHDPLYVRALVLDDGSGPAAIISLDLCILRTETCRALRQCVAERIKTDPERVVIACTHTHSGPDLGQLDIRYETGKTPDEAQAGGASDPGTRYLRTLPARLADAAARASFRMYPVVPRVQEAALGLGYDRRARTGEGVEHVWSPHEQFDLPCGPMPDPTCTVLDLDQEGGPRHYVVWSVSCHGVGLGPTSRVVSADWPGVACREVEGQVPGSHAMFLAGASGDTHPWIATQEDPAYLEPVGRAAGAFVALLTHGTRPADATLATAMRTVEIAGHEMDLAAWRIGRCRLLALPVELFSGLALALRERLGGPLIVSTVSNGWHGYWPTAEAFPEGGYEVEIAKRKGLSPGDGEKLVEAAAALAETLG